MISITLKQVSTAPKYFAFKLEKVNLILKLHNIIEVIKNILFYT